MANNITLSYPSAFYHQFLDKNGKPLTGGKLYTYSAGTSTSIPTYKTIGDTSSTNTNTNPIILDNAGVAHIVIETDKAYKFVLFDKNDAKIDEWDNVTGNIGGGGGSSEDIVVVGTPNEIDVSGSVIQGVKRYVVSLSNSVKSTILYLVGLYNNVLNSLGNKADKVQGATAGNIAALDANGNLTDSGSKVADFKTKQTPVADPSASGVGLEFIDSVTQDANGEITTHKKAVQDGTTAQKGVVKLSNAIDSTSVTEAATPKAVKDAYDKLNNKIVARAVFLSQAEWAVQSQLPGDPAKVYYVENGTGEDAYTVYVWKESTSTYEEVDESSIDLDGYWHDEPTTTGSGNVVTNITLGNDGVPQIEKGLTALTQHQLVTDNDPTLAWSTRSKVGTIGGTDLHVTMPSNPASGKLDSTGDASNTTSTFTKASGDSSSMTRGSKLSAIFTAISSFFASLKALAFKDTVGTGDINDDAITAAKVKDNETLPVNISGSAGSAQTLPRGYASFRPSVTGYKKIAELNPPSASNDIIAVFEIYETLAWGSGDSFKGLLTVRIRNNGGSYEYAANFIHVSYFRYVALSVRYDPSTHKLLLFAFESNDVYCGLYAILAGSGGWHGDNSNDNVTLFADTSTESVSGYTEVAITTSRSVIAPSGGAGSPTIPVYVDSNGQVQQCNPSQMSVGSATAASNYASGGGIDTALQGKLGTSGDGSNVSVTPDGTSTGYDLGSSTTLKAFAQKFKNLVGALKALAFKDKVSDNDISGTIADSHISSASTWNGKADKANITGATKCKITYNGQGIVTSGADLDASDIPNLAASKITSGQFGTDRIADDAITAAKVKDNETLPVNVSGAASQLSHVTSQNEASTWRQIAKLESSDANKVLAQGFVVAVRERINDSNYYTGTYIVSCTSKGSDCKILQGTRRANGYDMEFVVAVDSNSITLYATSSSYSPYHVTALFGNPTIAIGGALGSKPAGTDVAKTFLLDTSGQVGDTTTPVYVDSNGQVQPCDPSQMSVGNATKWDGHAISIGSVSSSAGTISIV